MIDSMRVGNKAEKLIANILESIGLDWESTEGKFTDYDIKSKLGKKEFTIEVKFDVMAQKTGNIAIEFYNSKSCIPSGISATKADLWAHCLQDGSNIAAWVCQTSKLKKFLDEVKPKRTIVAGGDDNASLHLYDIDIILPIFQRIDNIESEEIKKILKALLK